MRSGLRGQASEVTHPKSDLTRPNFSHLTKTVKATRSLTRSMPENTSENGFQRQRLKMDSNAKDKAGKEADPI